MNAPLNILAEPVELAKKQYVDLDQKNASVSKDETFWGYIIRDQTESGTASIVVKSLAALVGLAMFIAAAGLWFLAGSNLTLDVVVFKLGLTAVMALIAALLIWFASNGPKYEVQVDLNRQEIREATRNDRGQVRVYSRTKFSKFDAVILDRATYCDGKSKLLLRLAGSSEAIEIAQDYEEYLDVLKRRLGKDVLGSKSPIQKKPARGFLLEGAQGVVIPQTAA